MKRNILLLLLLPLMCAAQNPTTVDGWAQRLQLFGSKIPQEEVFIHMDNTCYYLGDTLYYKAYMRLSDGRPSMLSHLLYVELLNHDGFLVERQKVEMKNGQGYGSFALPDTLYGGYYELRAYTRWQLNWGLFEHPHTKSAERWFYSTSMAKEYYRDYEKLYSRVFPVYDKPREAGEYDQNMTMRPLRRLVKQDNEKPQAVVTFFPEGGNLVADVANRVAFEANDENGKHLNGSLSLTLPEGKGTSEMETVSRGRGAFVITPAAGEKITATFTWDGGSQEVELPQAVFDGVAMQARVETDGIHIDLSPEGRAAYEELGITASCHGVMKDFQPISSREILIPIDKLPTGVIQLTVFNFEGRVYADRLVFVRKPDFQPQTISFEGVKSQYEPYEQVTLDVKCKMSNGITLPSEGQGGGLSLAVRDAAHSDYIFDSGNILTEMLLSSQIRGFVEHPEYFFETDDEERRQALDLLLMVQGWRRYDWVTMATPGAFSIREPYEKTELLVGEVNTYDAEAQVNSIVDHMDRREAEMSTGSSDDEESEVSEADKRMSEMKAESDNMLSEVDSRQGTTYRTNAEHSENRFLRQLKRGGTLKEEAILHAEFTQPGAKEGESMVEGEMDTYNHGSFKIEAPKFYESCFFRFGATSHKNYKGENHLWVASGEDSKEEIVYPDYYVKLNPIFPRFVKPYNFYQTAVPKARPARKGLHFITDDIFVMDEVTVGARRGGLRTFDATKPAFVLDAYEAFNAACDAGLCNGYYIGSTRFADDVARTFIGDMNMERAYEIEQRFESKNMSSFHSAAQLEKYNHLPRLDMVYIYTDYSPRREGDKRYRQADQPIVTIDLRGFQDGGQRMTYRDRFMLLSGYSVCEDFYQPDYSKQKPEKPTDYRRTLYWNPNLQLDGEGRARVSFFTGSRAAQLILSAEGLSGSGQPLTGLSYPEDR